jgi:hypothetical protein
VAAASVARTFFLCTYSSPKQLGALKAIANNAHPKGRTRDEPFRRRRTLSVDCRGKVPVKKIVFRDFVGLITA